MSFENKTTNVAAAIYSKTDMNKTATATQVKKYSDTNTSFATEMKQTSEQEEVKSVEQTPETPKVGKVEKQEDTEKSETPKDTNNKVTKEQNSETQTLTKDSSDESQMAEDNQQGQFGQNQNNPQNEQNNIYMPLTNQIQAYMTANGVDLSFASINPMSATSHDQITHLAAKVDYTTVQMSDTDAKFFADLVAKTDMSAASVAAEFEKHMQQGNIKMVQSTAKASAALIEALKESSKNHQAFRVDFDKDISVILQVDRGGKINANFIPGDKAVEAYLRNNIESLRQRFNEENIAYGDINYSQSRRNRQNREENNKENR